MSQADEFAKYSKIERKILQLRQMLDAKNKDQSALKTQTSSAFYKCWHIIAVSGFFHHITFVIITIEVKFLFKTFFCVYIHKSCFCYILEPLRTNPDVELQYITHFVLPKISLV